jgi:type VI secretion system Hcp family effector
MKHFRTCLAALLFSLLLAPITHAGVILVLKLDGIDGDSIVAGHANEITVNSSSFAIEQAALTAGKDAGTAGMGAGKAVFSPLVISKNSDKASPQLFLRSALGTAIKNAKLSFLMVTPFSSAPPVEFFSIRLSGLYVTKYSVAASNSDETSFEEVMFYYRQILITYTPSVGPQIVTGFDLKLNKPISQLE